MLGASFLSSCVSALRAPTGQLMNPNYRNLALWAIIAVLLIALFNLFQTPQTRGASSEVAYSQFLQDVAAGRVKTVTIAGARISGTYTDSSDRLPDLFAGRPVAGFAAAGQERHHQCPARNRRLQLAVRLSDLLAADDPDHRRLDLLHAPDAGRARGGAMGFGKSKAKLLTEAHGRVTFEDVAGVDEAKEDLEEIVEFLRDPQKFQRLGGKIPRGVLLVGPPGTGKTLLARSVAGEANVPFFTISGSDFVEMFVGVGASRVRDMFEQAKKNAPCIIFIDEIDAVGRHRGAGLGGGNDEREQTLNQLLVEMDGFEANEGIILIAATNRPDVLDPALLRPGRFDRQVVVPNPDIIGREKILKVHVRNVPLAPNVDLKVLARGTPGFSGADLMNLVNEAALMAARRNKRLVTMAEFEDAKDKIMMGAERRSVGHDRGREEAHRLSRGRPRHPGAQRAVGRSAAQGDDHPARPCARHGHAAAGRRPLFDELQVDGLAPRHHDGRPRRRGDQVRQGEHHLRRLLRHRAGDQAGPRHGHAAGASPTSSARSPMATTRKRCSSAIRWRARRTSRKRPRRSSTPKCAG